MQPYLGLLGSGATNGKMPVVTAGHGWPGEGPGMSLVDTPDVTTLGERLLSLSSARGKSR